MFQRVELRLDGGSDGRMLVPVNVRPDGGVSINVFSPMLVPKPNAFATRDDQRFMFRRTPILHRRERMPQVLLVQRDEFGGGGWVQYDDG